MDFATIATGAITALAPLVKKGAEKIAEKSAEEGFTHRQAIWEMVKGLFVEDEPILLNIFQEAGTDAKAQAKLEGRLESKLEAHPDIAEKLQALIQKLPKMEMKQNTITITGDNNFAGQDITGSTITINK